MAMMTRTPARTSVNSTSSMASRIETERSFRMLMSTPLIISAWMVGSMRLDPVDHLDGVGVGLAVDREQDGAGAVEPARDLVVLDAVDGGGHVGERGPARRSASSR